MRERVAKSAGSGSTAKAGISSENEAVEGEGLTETHPRSYQSELFTLVMASERNALVYLPTGLGKTLVSIMAVQRMLELNPERQAYFLVETNALVIQQVCFGGRFEVRARFNTEICSRGGENSGGRSDTRKHSAITRRTHNSVK